MGTKKHGPDAVTVSRDAKTGRMVPAGYGALKGKYVVRKGIDVVEPIFEQVSCRARQKEVPRKRSKG